MRQSVAQSSSDTPNLLPVQTLANGGGTEVLYQNSNPAVNQRYFQLSQRSGSYGGRLSANQSFTAKPSLQGAFGPPGATSTYEQWKEQLSAQLKHHHSNQPQINDHSRRIIEHKRLLNNPALPPGGVHHRLHQ
jgi:hypothetical protein